MKQIAIFICAACLSLPASWGQGQSATYERCLQLANDAQAQAKAGNYREAIGTVSEAISLAEKDPFYWQRRASYYRQIKDWAHAIADLDKAILLSNPDPSLFNQKAACEMFAAQYQEAIADTQSSLNIVALPETYVLRSQIYHKAGAQAKELAEIRQAILCARARGEDGKNEIALLKRMAPNAVPPSLPHGNEKALMRLLHDIRSLSRPFDPYALGKLTGLELDEVPILNHPQWHSNKFQSNWMASSPLPKDYQGSGLSAIDLYTSPDNAEKALLILSLNVSQSCLEERAIGKLLPAPYMVTDKKERLYLRFQYNKDKCLNKIFISRKPQK